MDLRLRHFVAGAALFTFLSSSAIANAAHARYRLTLREDPATSMVIAWDQQGGSDPKVHWDTVDHGTNVSAYANATAASRVANEKGMNNHFVRLSGLKPETAYYFVVADSSGPSKRFWFKTAPNVEKPFSIIAGGDSRNNREPRRNGNQAVAKLRPLLVMFGGDFTDSNSDIQWQEWFDDWQDSISPDGRMYPLVAARGNHDSNEAIERLWDSPSRDVYFALNVAGKLARFYTLNSEIAPGGTQRDWLTKDLAENRCSKYRIAQYHRPMRPHTSGKAEGSDVYDAWAQLFFDERMDLVVECDSHTVKRTWPIAPKPSGGDQGFVRDDSKGTVYIGEGCWGAPLRPSDDAKSWTRAHGSFNEVNWLIFRNDRIDVRTIRTDDIAKSASVSDSNPFEPPENLPVWNADHGSVASLLARTRSETCETLGNEPVVREVLPLGSTWRYHDRGRDIGLGFKEPEYDDSAWQSGPAELGYGDGDEATVIEKGSPNYSSYYFRTAFELPLEGGTVIAADLNAIYDDGIAVWVNGVTALTQDVGSLSYSAFATATIDNNASIAKTIDPKLFRDGKNIVAAMVKQVNNNSSDVSFDLSLKLTIQPGENASGSGGAAGSNGASGASGSSSMNTGGASSQTGGTSSVSGNIAGGQAASANHPPTGDQREDGSCSCGVPTAGGAAAGLSSALFALLLLRYRRQRKN